MEIDIGVAIARAVLAQFNRGRTRGLVRQIQRTGNIQSGERRRRPDPDVAAPV